MTHCQIFLTKKPISKIVVLFCDFFIERMVSINHILLDFLSLIIYSKNRSFKIYQGFFSQERYANDPCEHFCQKQIDVAHQYQHWEQPENYWYKTEIGHQIGKDFRINTWISSSFSHFWFNNYKYFCTSVTILLCKHFNIAQYCWSPSIMALARPRMLQAWSANW